jgi:hypothetical protein
MLEAKFVPEISSLHASSLPPHALYTASRVSVSVPTVVEMVTLPPAYTKLYQTSFMALAPPQVGLGPSTQVLAFEVEMAPPPTVIAIAPAHWSLAGGIMHEPSSIVAAGL